jgi:hypothetical protein
MSRDREARREVARSVERVVKQLRAIQTSVEDNEGESLAVIAARLGEANDRLARVADETREQLTAGLLVFGDEDEEER